MKYKDLLKKVACLGMGLGALLISSADIAANLAGQWIQHPAASLRNGNKESQVVGIIDGRRYVYFSVRGADFKRNDEHLASFEKKVDPMEIFRYDKTTPWEEGCIKPLAQEFELSGSMPVVVNYSPARGILAVVYENRWVDFIYDDGTVVTSSAVLDINVPAVSGQPYSITFDSERPCVYVGAPFGIAAVNIETGDLEKAIALDKPVIWAGRVGEKIVAFAGKATPEAYATQTYVFPEDEAPDTLNAPIADGANLQALMPLSTKTFAAVASSSDTQQSVKLFTLLDDGTVKSETIVTSGTVDNQATANFRHFFRTDGFVSPWRDGFAVYDNGVVTFIKAGVDVDYSASNPLQDFIGKAVITVSKSSLDTAAEKNAKAASYDGQTVYFYSYESSGLDMSPRGFYSRSLTGSSWSEPSSIVAPNAPGTTLANSVRWHPDYGVLLRGPGSSYDHGTTEKDFFFAYKDGRWTDLTYNANNSKYGDITNHTRSIAIDPLNPDWIWSVSVKAGLFRMNLSDYNNYFCIGTTNNAARPTNYPGYYAAFDFQSNYPSLANFSNVDFDNEGRMWFARDYLYGGYYDYEDFTGSKVPLYYLTAEERSNIETLGPNLKTLFGQRELVIPKTYSYRYQMLLALKHPSNSNYLATSHLFTTGDFRRFAVYDHAGTPEDPSDDRWAFVDDLYDENGDKFIYNEDRGCWEDMTTGDLWYFTNTGPALINPSELLDGKRTCRRPRISKKFGVDADENPFEQISIKNIAVDNLGRKWMATEQGLYCLSADNSELLAHYTASNSPLPHDELTDVACDGVTGAVYVLTLRGMAEFHPEGSTAPLASGEHLSIWPATVDPAYKGYVNVSGAVSGAQYEVLDAEGAQVCLLGETADGTLQWNCLDKEGRRVEPGRYSIRRVGHEETHRVIVAGK